MNNYFSEIGGTVKVKDFAAELVAEFAKAGYTASGLTGHLGPHGVQALHRGEPGAVEFALRDGTQLDHIIRAFVLHDAVTQQELVAAVGTDLAAKLIDSRVAIPATADPDNSCYVIALDIRPHIIKGHNHWVFSDVDASLVPHVPGSDHVLGVGAASLSLLHLTPTTPVDTVLDLGTGSGVQLLGQLECAGSITATDIHPRALQLAAATVAGATAAGATTSKKVELLAGPWFEPVAGRRFDRIVANPPFVVGLPEVGHIYRDSGLNLDGASELVVSQVADYLNLGARAYILAAWVQQGQQSWQQRVSSWLPDTGVRAWIIQRDVVDPALYVSTWLKDESQDLRSPEGREKARIWLEHFKRHEVENIGFGFVVIERLEDDEPSDVLAEELSHSFDDPLSQETEEYFVRADWLHSLAPGEFETKRFVARPGLAKEEISTTSLVPPTAAPDEYGFNSPFTPAALRLTRTDGPRWKHDVDEHLMAIVSGLNPAGLNLEDTVGLYAAAHGFEEEELLASAIPAVIDLVRHGLVLPTDLLEQN